MHVRQNIVWHSCIANIELYFVLTFADYYFIADIELRCDYLNANKDATNMYIDLYSVLSFLEYRFIADIELSCNHSRIKFGSWLPYFYKVIGIIAFTINCCIPYKNKMLSKSIMQLFNE